MRRTLLAIVLTVLGTAITAAQNNPYQIDDKCYGYFQRAELLIGKVGFTEVNDSLLMTAMAAGDKKAETLYYVERLKNATRVIPNHTATTDAQDLEILNLQEELKAISDKNGYPQYFYYSYEIVQNYFYNHDKNIRTMEILQDLQRVAQQRNDSYGMWMSQRYMVALYVVQGDYINAKPYILKAIQIYNESKDPVVKRQTLSRLYCDLSDTYVIGADSVNINVDKAVKTAVTHLDSLRCAYHLAKIAAYEKRPQDFQYYRDYCLNDRQISSISETAPIVLRTIDAIIDGKFDSNTISKLAVANTREIKYIANVAEQYDYKEQGFEIERLLVKKFERQIAASNRSKIAEMDARLGNTTLQGELAHKKEEVQNITRLVLILAIAILVAIMTFMIVHISALNRHNKELMEANRKVKLADEAKTRFIQNMSHEVRTPLNAIVGFSQLLSLPDGALSPEEKDEFSAHIINNTKMLTMLLDDILNASAMDSGKYSFTYETADRDYIAQQAISSSEHRLQPGVTLTYVPEEKEPLQFTTDPRRVQQILINLITNACKHTKEGSIVVASSLTETPGFLTYSVTDTGTGVPPEDAEKIFERFTKLNEYVQGTGLGLSICRDIAGRMGGKVYLDTTHTGKGARFVFTIPTEPVKPE
ncbi:MAG: HAMP domain-containing histidine kinase [Bacteroidales bacterium]|nr:HAMP domain-containing histidine kinase [Bacteroidales bacterium]